MGLHRFAEPPLRPGQLPHDQSSMVSGRLATVVAKGNVPSRAAALAWPRRLWPVASASDATVARKSFSPTAPTSRQPRRSPPKSTTRRDAGGACSRPVPCRCMRADLNAVSCTGADAVGRLGGGSSRWSCPVWSHGRLLSQRICSVLACQRPGVGGALLAGLGRWNLRLCSGVWSLPPGAPQLAVAAGAGAGGDLEASVGPLPQATFAALLSMLAAYRDAHHSRRYRRG